MKGQANFKNFWWYINMDIMIPSVIKELMWRTNRPVQKLLKDSWIAGTNVTYLMSKKLYTAWARGVFKSLHHWFPSVFNAFTKEHNIMSEKVRLHNVAETWDLRDFVFGIFLFVCFFFWSSFFLSSFLFVLLRHSVSGTHTEMQSYILKHKTCRNKNPIAITRKHNIKRPSPAMNALHCL